jgi:hypothetical protein
VSIHVGWYFRQSVVKNFEKEMEDLNEFTFPLLACYVSNNDCLDRTHVMRRTTIRPSIEYRFHSYLHTNCHPMHTTTLPGKRILLLPG